MSTSLKFRVILSTAALLLLCCVPVSRAAYVISLQQVGSNVVGTGNGSIDFTDLTSPMPLTTSAVVFSGSGIVGLGPATATAATEYTGATGPANFGSGNPFFANSGSGPVVGVAENLNQILVPAGYVSASALATSTDTWTNQTFATLGLTPGTYTYTWGIGQDADSLTVQIGPATTGVPLPRSIYLGAVLLPLGLLLRKRTITA